MKSWNLYLLIGVAVVSITGCSSVKSKINQGKISASATTESATTDSATTEETSSDASIEDKITLYADLVRDLEDQYGQCRMEPYPHFGPNEDAVCYRGVCFLDLVDFNKDGQNELVVSYDAGEYEYQTAIYGVEDGQAVKLWEGYSGGDGAPAVFHARLATKSGYPAYLQWSGISFIGITVNASNVAEEDDCGAPDADTSEYDLEHMESFSFNGENQDEKEFTDTAAKYTETRSELGLGAIEIKLENMKASASDVSEKTPC